MKRFFSTLLVAMLIVACFATSAFAAGNGTVTVGNVNNAEPGDTVTVTYTVSGEFANFEIFVSSELEIVDIYDDNDKVVANKSTGKVVFAQAENVRGNSFTFKVDYKVPADADKCSYAVKASVSGGFISDRDLVELAVTVSNGTVSLNHAYDAGVVTTPASCEGKGETTYTCTRCGHSYTQPIDATGHTWGDWTVTTPVTCTVDGEETRTCSVCGKTETKVITAPGHTEADAVKERVVTGSCTEPGSYDLVVYCSVCGDELERTKVVETEPGHAWDEGKVTTPVTCTTDGVKTYTCSVCGETKTETIKSEGHKKGNPVKENEVKATCTEGGTYEEVVYCSVCNVELSRTNKTSEATGHAWGEWVVAEPFCEQTGTRTRTCANCGLTETETIDATGHTWAEDHLMDDECHWLLCLVCGCESAHEHHIFTEVEDYHYVCDVCGYDYWDQPEDPDIDEEPKPGDFTLELALGVLMILGVVAIVYTTKRRIAK